jgi:hypothetical protein
MGKWINNSTILDLGTMEIILQLHVPVALPPVKTPLIPIG